MLRNLRFKANLTLINLSTLFLRRCSITALTHFVLKLVPLPWMNHHLSRRLNILLNRIDCAIFCAFLLWKITWILWKLNYCSKYYFSVFKRKTRLTYKCAQLRSTRESLTFEYDIWWYWVSMGRYWFVLGGTGSVWSGAGWYMMVLGQKKAVLVSTWWYWVSMGRYWLVLGGTVSA